MSFAADKKTEAAVGSCATNAVVALMTAFTSGLPRSVKSFLAAAFLYWTDKITAPIVKHTALRAIAAEIAGVLLVSTVLSNLQFGLPQKLHETGFVGKSVA